MDSPRLSCSESRSEDLRDSAHSNIQGTVEAYLKRIEEKEGSAPLAKSLDRDEIEQTLIIQAFRKNPEKLYLKLQIIRELARLEPYLKIDMDSMREMIRDFLVARKRAL